MVETRRRPAAPVPAAKHPSPSAAKHPPPSAAMVETRRSSAAPVPADKRPPPSATMVETRRSSAAPVHADKRPPPSAAMVEFRRSSAAPVSAGKRPPPSAASIRGKKLPPPSAASIRGKKRPPPSAASIRGKKRRKVRSFPIPPPLHAADPATGAFASSPERISTTPRGRRTAETELPRNLRAQSSQTTSADASSIAAASILASLSVLENNLAVSLMASNVKNVQQGRDIPSLPSGCDAPGSCSPDNDTNRTIGKEYTTSEFDLGENVFKVCKDHREIPQNLGSPTLPSVGCQAFNDAFKPGISSTSDIQASVDTHRRRPMARKEKGKKRRTKKARKKAHEEVQGQEVTQEGTAVSTAGSSRGRKPRGPTRLDAIVMLPKGHKVPVILNSRGQPIDQGSITLSSYLGKIAKTVDINVDNWRHLDEEMRNSLWERVETKYDLPDTKQDDILKQMGECWRRWKSILTRKFIKPFVKANDIRGIPTSPPPMYSLMITDDQWKSFVKKRVSEKFLVLSKAQSVRRSKNICNHLISRKGYARFAEGLAIKLGKKVEDIERGELWCEARKRGATFPDEASERVAEKYRELKMMEAAGEIFTKGSNDLLTMALGTPEHSGRVRAGGIGSIPSKYFCVPRSCKREYIERISQLEEENRELRERLSRGRASSYMEPTVEALSDKSIASGLGDPGAGDDDHKAGVRCMLAYDHPNNIVASGFVFPYKKGELLHCVPLPSNCRRVHIGVVISCPDAPLPIPIPGECDKISDALGIPLAWPSHLIILDSLPQEKRPVDPKEKRPVDPKLSKYEKSIERFRIDIYEPMSVAAGFAWIPIPIEDALFNRHTDLHLDMSDMKCIVDYDRMTENAILFYCFVLYQEMKVDHLTDSFRFGNMFQYDFRSLGTEGDTGPEILAGYLRAMPPKCTTFLILNPGDHWFLLAIKDWCFYYLDSCGNAINPFLQKLVVKAMDIVYQFDHVDRGIPNWVYVRVPIQPDNISCGFYALRCIREIIGDKTGTPIEKISGFARNAYKKDQIDVIRAEWVDSATPYIKAYVPTM